METKNFTTTTFKRADVWIWNRIWRATTECSIECSTGGTCCIDEPVLGLGGHQYEIKKCGPDLSPGLVFTCNTYAIYMQLAKNLHVTNMRLTCNLHTTLQVMNVNCAPAEAVGLVGYLPKLEVSETCRSMQSYKDCANHILQECIGHILKFIEKRSVHGFTAVLAGEKKTFFARLGAMTLDTKERVKYYGLRSDRTCGFCRLRLGRSVTREATRHDGAVLDLLMAWATKDVRGRDEISQRSKARLKLARHGWQYKRKCRMNEFAKNCLVQIPRFGPVPFAGLIHFERMHIFNLNFCTYCMELLTVCVINPEEVSKRARSCHQFRDPVTGVTHPRLPSLMKMTHFTAERRVRAVFVWAHVLGTEADVIHPDMRVHAQVAVATLQILLIATRGHRAYTETELNTIFKDVGKQFFSALEAIAAFAEAKRMQGGLEAHRKRPTVCRKPLPYKRQNRCVQVTCNLHA